MTPVSTAALIIRDGRLLLVRRGPGGDLGDLWELPGGKVDAGESPEAALARELDEELGIGCSVGAAVAEASFTHHGRRYRLLGYLVDAPIEQIELREHVAQGLFAIDEALALRLAPSDRSLLVELPETIRSRCRSR